MIKSTLLFLSLSASFLPAADWTQWRSPTRDGQIHQDAAPWLNTLTKENLKRLWSVDLAEGYASPIIAEEPKPKNLVLFLRSLDGRHIRLRHFSFGWFLVIGRKKAQAQNQTFWCLTPKFQKFPLKLLFHFLLENLPPPKDVFTKFRSPSTAGFA